MKFEIGKDYIKVFEKSQFNPLHILECGQVFCYSKEGEIYKVYPLDQYAEIEENDDYYVIKTKNPHFFVNFFDLERNYDEIKSKLSKFNIMTQPLAFGEGIRILNQDLFEMLISFIISANNNIKRIKLILGNIRRNFGEKIAENIYSFPTFQKLCSVDEEFFKQMGAGYRAQYLVKVLKQITPKKLLEYQNLDSISLRKALLSLYGVGPKVADCIMLFGYHRGDVFPVDTWIEQMYCHYYEKLDNREQIRNNLLKQFGDLSGYAQQYLFYFSRTNLKKL